MISSSEPPRENLPFHLPAAPSVPPPEPATAERGYHFGTPVSELFKDPAGYQPGESLQAAVKVALWLGMPLLLTGGPGCGKTSLAAWLARELRLAPPLVFNVKSGTTGRELLYEFDELARFRDAQAGERFVDKARYLRFNALGQAILLAGGAASRSDDVRRTATRKDDHFSRSELAAASLPPGDATPGFGQRHVVLIDELDKAPRDTPNDLLLEILEMRFQIRELDTWVVGDPALRPVVVMTSNSEKSLPEPFLRRCVFHHIAMPDDAARRRIVQRRMHPFAQRGALFDHAMQLFDQLSGELGREPGTAELLAWLTALEQRAAAPSTPDAAPVALRELARDTLGALAKTTEDIARAETARAQFVPAHSIPAAAG